MHSPNSLPYVAQRLIENGANYPRRSVCVSSGALACISLASDYAAKSGKKTLIVDLDADVCETTLHLTPKPKDVFLEPETVRQSDLVTAIDAEMTQFVADAAHYVRPPDTPSALTVAANAVANCTFNQVVTAFASPRACDMVTTCNTGGNLYLMRCDRGFSLLNQLFAACIRDCALKANSLRLPCLSDMVWFIDALMLSIHVPNPDCEQEHFDSVYFSVGRLHNNMDYVAKLAAIRCEFLSVIAYATFNPAINVLLGLKSVDEFYSQACRWPKVGPLAKRPIVLPVLLCNFMVICQNECDSTSVRMLMEINKAVNDLGASEPRGVVIRPPDACMSAQLFIPLMPTYSSAAFESACALADLDNAKLQFYLYGRTGQDLAEFTQLEIDELLPIAQKQISIIGELYNRLMSTNSLR